VTPAIPEAVEGGGLRLRRHRAEDGSALFEAARESIAEVHPWLPWCHPGYRLEEAQEWVDARPGFWERGEGYEFVIEDAESGRFLGGVCLNQLNAIHKSANLGYWIRTDACGRGVATAATVLAAQFGLEALGLVRIEIVAAVENRPSQRVAEKSGALREGILRNRLLLHGVPHDALMFSIVPGWKPPQGC